MFERILAEIRDKIRLRQYIMTVHAEEEMSDDELSIFDLERNYLPCFGKKRYIWDIRQVLGIFAKYGGRISGENDAFMHFSPIYAGISIGGR